MASKQLPMTAEDINTSVIKVIEHLVSSKKIPLLQEGYFKKRSGMFRYISKRKNVPCIIFPI